MHDTQPHATSASRLEQQRRELQGLDWIATLFSQHNQGVPYNNTLLRFCCENRSTCPRVHADRNPKRQTTPLLVFRLFQTPAHAAPCERRWRLLLLLGFQRPCVFRTADTYICVCRVYALECKVTKSGTKIFTR